MAARTRGIAGCAMLLVGVGVIMYGVWLVWPPLFYVMLGAIVIGLAISIVD